MPEAHGAVPVEDVPLAVLDVRDLLFGIIDLLLAVSELLLRLGFLRCVFGAGGVQLLLAGIVFSPAVIQPGGSIKDELSFEYCNEHGIAMVTTGFRHFKH